MWILPKNLSISSAPAPECVASKEDLKEHLFDLVGMRRKPSLMWKSKPLPFGTWLSKWNRVYWLPRLFGRTLKPSLSNNFTIKYTQSLVDIHVNPSVLLERGGGVSDPRHLWPYIFDGMRTTRPLFGFFENVRNHLNIGFEQVKSDLESIGYRVEPGIFSAEECGAPHKRDRLFILAMDHSFSKGLEGYTWNDCRAKGWQEPAGPASPTSFPLGQGYNQNEWEASRLKPRMDLTINGYDFTEDLLRMAGNGVVEQVAELAFLTLIKKFYNAK